MALSAAAFAVDGTRIETPHTAQNEDGLGCAGRDKTAPQVFLPAGSNNQFKRTEVRGGKVLPGGKQEILSGLAPGQQVVANALSLESSVSQ